MKNKEVNNYKNFVWKWRVQNKNNSIFMSFDGFVNKIDKKGNFDVEIKKDGIEVHNSEVFSSQFLNLNNHKNSLLSWCYNLSALGYLVNGDTRKTNLYKKLLENGKFIVGSGNEGYIEAFKNHLIKNIMKSNKYNKNNLKMYKDYELTINVLVPEKQHWLPDIIKNDHAKNPKRTRFFYKNNIYPIDREIKLKEYTEFFVQMLKSEYTLKDFKIENLAFKNNKLIFNDLGKSISHFDKDNPKHVEWTSSILRKVFWIYKNPNKKVTLKVYEDLELINEKEFINFKKNIFIKSGVKIIDTTYLDDEHVNRLYDVFKQWKKSTNKYNNKYIVPPVVSVAFDNNQNYLGGDYNTKGNHKSHAEWKLLDKIDFENKKIILITTISPCSQCGEKIQNIKNILSVNWLFEKYGKDKVEHFDGKHSSIMIPEKLVSKSAIDKYKEMIRIYKYKINKNWVSYE